MDALPEVVEISRAEGIAMFERQTQKLLGIGVDEFMARYDAGEFQDTCDYLDLIMLIPFAR